MAKETKEERFKRVAEKRVQNTLKSLRSLAQLSNKKAYKWNSKQLDKIWSAIDEEINNCKKSFHDPNSGVFKL